MSLTPSLLFSTEFCISCGTVTFDTRAKKVMLVYNRPSSEYLLPKGRKNPSEALESAAVRETFEESGIRCELLPHAFRHLAPPSTEEEAAPGKLSTEPIAVQQRTSMGAWKLIFWYIASADSTIARVEGTQESYEHFDTVWVDAAKAAGMIAKEHDAQVVKKAVQVVFGIEKPEL